MEDLVENTQEPILAVAGVAKAYRTGTQEVH